MLTIRRYGSAHIRAKPTQVARLVAIRSFDGKRVVKMIKWGLISHWAKDDKI